MRSIVRFGIVCIVFMVTLAIVPVAPAQQASEPTPAPVPEQILTARKIFISNARGDAVAGAIPPNLAYDELYAAIKTWGKYQLAGTPADADLIFQISFLGTQAGGPIRLVIIDPKTHVALWPLAEFVQTWARGTTGRKNFDKAMADLVEDLKQVVSQAPGATNPAAPE